MSASFTVAICTRNRPDLLRLCLESLVQAMQEAGHPVLVVDNDPADDTASIVEEFEGKLDIQYVPESKTGLSHARNRALRECKTEYIVYLDDDAKPDPGWIDAIEKGIQQWSPDFFGGPYRPFYREEKPPWFEDEFGSQFTDREERPLERGEHVAGGNMGWRVPLLRSIGGFPTSLGMIGDRLRLGEETYLVNLVHRLYPERRGIFLPDMSMEHLVSEHKFSLWYAWKRAWNYGKQLPVIDPDAETVGWKEALLESPFFARLVWRLFIRDREQYPYWRTYAMHCIGRSAVIFGAFFSPYKNTTLKARSTASDVLQDVPVHAED